jgi:hypothetical protein
LVTLDVKWAGRTRNFVDVIYQACRKAVGGPVCLLAADAIRQKVTKDSTVIVMTGFVLPPFFPRGETDGPPGAVAMAHAIQKGLGARVLFLTDREVMDPLQATCRAAGLSVYNPEDFKKIPGAITVRDFPYEREEAVREASRILDDHRPAAVISIEKIGRNEKDIYHTARGSEMGRTVAKTDLLMDAANERGLLTIGIGDFGNEIGMGTVGEVARAAIGELGKKCHCGCGGGVVTKVRAQFPIFASISNWGGYGVAACLAALLGKPEALHSPRIEGRMIEACVQAGGKDGTMVTPTLSNDGVFVEGNRGVVRLLHEIIRVKTAGPLPFRS